MGLKIVENLNVNNCKRVGGFIVIDSLLPIIKPTHYMFNIVEFIKPCYLKNNRLYFEFKPNKFIVIEQKCQDVKRNSIKIPDYATPLNKSITILLKWLY